MPRGHMDMYAEFVSVRRHILQVSATGEKDLIRKMSDHAAGEWVDGLQVSDDSNSPSPKPHTPNPRMVNTECRHCRQEADALNDRIQYLRRQLESTTQRYADEKRRRIAAERELRQLREDTP